ncbi:hypothetical protein GCM10009613_00450 [Pseudonocardia kongjuensis]|uniref:Uncharacterized protein n=1 Tax=Pseudonocardia kongjuensis TaxID=102227 RepID=A0ABN1XFH3_9PSEU
MQTDTLGRKPPGLIGYLVGSGVSCGRHVTLPLPLPGLPGGGRTPARGPGGRDRWTKVDPGFLRSS